VTDRARTGEQWPSGDWLRVELHSQERTCTLVLSGALRDTSIAALAAQVDQLGCVPCDDVVVDVSRLTALDPTGANVLLGLYHYVDGRGGNLRIVGATGPIATALHQYAREYAEADDALSQTIEDPPTLSPETLAPETLAPETLAPETLAPETLAPEPL
jgi:ABC-type transporter Mla MlaB component